MTTMQQYEEKMKRAGFAISSKPGMAEGSWKGHQGTSWKVTITYQRRKMTTSFHMGSAHRGEPMVADVLSCLILDATSYYDADGFEDWASNYGYDTDSRKAEDEYNAVARAAAKIERLLGGRNEVYKIAKLLEGM